MHPPRGRVARARGTRGRRRASPGRRSSRVRGTRPSRCGGSARAAGAARGRRACGRGTTAARCRRCRGRRRVGARRCAASRSTYSDCSMSMRRKVPSSPARETSRSTFAYATSSSKARPRWVSLSATFAFSCSATSRSRICSYSSVTADAPAASGIASPRSVVLAWSPASFSLRRTATHSSSVSPATNRAAPTRLPWLCTSRWSRALSAAWRIAARGSAATVFPGSATRSRAYLHWLRTCPAACGRQFCDGSGGIAARTPNGPPLRRSTTLQSSSGWSVNTSSASAGSTIQDPSSSSSSSWPGPQPA